MNHEATKLTKINRAPATAAGELHFPFEPWITVRRETMEEQVDLPAFVASWFNLRTREGIVSIHTLAALSLVAIDTYLAVGALLAAVLVAVVLLAIGLRGRRVDDHPLCRRCRFDLFNLPATSERCPECGAMLSAKRAIVIGHRRRRRGMLWVAACLLLVATGVGVRTGQQFARGIDPDTLKPDWFLFWQAGSGNSTTRGYAIDLLLERDAIDGLDANELEKLGARIVAADPAGA